MFVAKAERTYPVDRDTLWAMWTDPEHLARWFKPSLDAFGPSIAKVDLRTGGDYRIEMVRKDGEVFAVSGQFVDVEQPTRLTFTWRWDGTPDTSLVEVSFIAETDGGSSVALTHTKLVSQEDVDGHTEGWVCCLDSLAGTVRADTLA